MQTINIFEARANFSKVVSQVAAGEEIIIAKAGKPVARLVPYQEAPQKERTLGIYEGQMAIPEGFDDPLPDEIMRYFLGEGD